MDPEYVGIETKRIVDTMQGRCAVIPGIGVDVPNTMPGAPNGGKRPSNQAALTSAITKAFEAGAKGILISREYDEMRLEKPADDWRDTARTGGALTSRAKHLIRYLPLVVSRSW